MAIKGVLLDLGGVVYLGDTAISGAIEAVGQLREAGLPVRFLTNTTTKPMRLLRDKLEGLGLEIGDDELFVPALAACAALDAAGLRAHLLGRNELREDFEGYLAEAGGEPGALVVGDARDGFTYQAMNEAFRVLVEQDALFLALAKNRRFQDEDDRPSLDAGPFVAALEYAAGREATVLGKPSGDFFEAAVRSLGVEPAETVMVGDDAEADVGGALAAGLPAVLVRTGKYRDGDEDGMDPPPTAVVDDLSGAVERILENRG